MGAEEGILYAECNLDLGIQMKLRHDFAGHYNRPDIFQLQINRAAPQALFRAWRWRGSGAHVSPRCRGKAGDDAGTERAADLVGRRDEGRR